MLAKLFVTLLINLFYFIFLTTIAQAQTVVNDYKVKIGEDSIIYQANIQYNGVVPPPYGLNMAQTAESEAVGNLERAHVIAYNNQAGHAYAGIGVGINWDLTGRSWDEVKDIPLKIVAKFNYRLKGQVGKLGAGVQTYIAIPQNAPNTMFKYYSSSFGGETWDEMPDDGVAVFELPTTVEHGSAINFNITAQASFYCGQSCEVPDEPNIAYAELELISIAFIFNKCNGEKYTFQISNAPDCGLPSPAVGQLSPKWGLYDKKPVLKSHAGDKLELHCVNSSYFALLYTPPPGEHIDCAEWLYGKCRVGKCPFKSGVNFPSVTVSLKEGEVPGTGTDPECFISSSWTSVDFGDNDNEAPHTSAWTNMTDEEEAQEMNTTVIPILDVASSQATLRGGDQERHLSKINEGYQYSYGPPIFPYPLMMNPFGEYLGLIVVDPPLGPETEVFFDQVAERLQALPQDGPMSMSLLAPCDMNRDGICDEKDVAIFQEKVGLCRDNFGYTVFADYNGSGCIDEVDQFELFGRDSDEDGIPDAGDNCLTIANSDQSDLDHDNVGDICDNCPALFNPDQTDSDGNGIGEACEQGINRPPVANAGPDQTVECAGPNGTSVTLDGSGSSDPDGDSLTFTWTGPFGTATGSNPTITLPLGIHTLTLTVDDGHGGTASDTVFVTVRDTTPATLSVTLSPNSLWPPNHKMVTVTANVQVSDTCDPNPTVTLISITSNEPDNGLGEGDTPNDIQGAAFGTDDRTFALRAERSGSGTGRIYTAIYQAQDHAGNTSTATAQVVVPHDQGK